MSKYIDAEKLKVFLEKEKAENIIGGDYSDGVLDTCDNTIAFINSLQHEQQEVDYEKDLTEWMEAGPHTCYPWCTIPDAIKITAEHFYELGLNARKEEQK